MKQEKALIKNNILNTVKWTQLNTEVICSMYSKPEKHSIAFRDIQPIQKSYKSIVEKQIFSKSRKMRSVWSWRENQAVKSCVDYESCISSLAVWPNTMKKPTSCVEGVAVVVQLYD